MFYLDPLTLTEEKPSWRRMLLPVFTKYWIKNYVRVLQGGNYVTIGTQKRFKGFSLWCKIEFLSGINERETHDLTGFRQAEFDIVHWTRNGARRRLIIMISYYEKEVLELFVNTELTLSLEIFEQRDLILI